MIWNEWFLFICIDIYNNNNNGEWIVRVYNGTPLYQNRSATRWCCNCAIMWNVNTWYHRTLGTIGGEYTKETVQYTDLKEIKTMFHSILCRFISAFLKIYWQISMCIFFSKRDSWKPPTYQTKLTSFEKNVTYCDDVLRNVRKKKHK